MLRKIISYILPLTKKIRSEHNGVLELTTINGKTYLNTEHTNYSYGSLQKILKFALQHTDISHTKNILLLGLGGGSVIKSLRDEFGYRGRITAVDIDPVIIDIAQNEYGISEDESTRIICQDAFGFALHNQDKYDLVIVDLFVDNVIPDKFISVEFWRAIINQLQPEGSIIFNTLCDPRTDTEPVENKWKKRGLTYQVFRYVERTNRVLIARLHDLSSAN